MVRNCEQDIARNVKTIDWLKSELLVTLGSIYRSMAKGNEDPRVSDIANLVIESYLLGKSLGVNFSDLDEVIDKNLTENIDNGHQIEQWYGDFTSLLNHRKGRCR